MERRRRRKRETRTSTTTDGGLVGRAGQVSRPLHRNSTCTASVSRKRAAVW
ncbi:unnamed protein product [Ectocarpus sp. CCAP 1310/34]|nr:unnamed protein product [Ectocarpus sp. CCAP 1310/34]